MLALWKAAIDKKDEDAAGQWQKQATAAVNALEQTHGPYWGRRGELELLRVAGNGSTMSSVEILGRTADNLYLKEQFDEAILTYERAAQQARAVADAEAAITWECKAALIEQQLKRHQAPHNVCNGWLERTVPAASRRHASAGRVERRPGCS